MTLFGRIQAYFSSVLAELGKVTWPTRGDVIRHTFIIAAAVVLMIIFLGVVDFILTTVLRDFILS